MEGGVCVRKAQRLNWPLLLVALRKQTLAHPSMPQLGYESTAQRVLAIPELLHIIFSFGTRASNASNALVCRNWREAALDHVWMEVDDLYHLLQLLAPLHRRRGETQFYTFQRTPTPEDWARFAPYACRLRTLKFGTDQWASVSDRAVPLGDSVFYDLARSRTTLEVFPNLRRLWWETEYRALQSQHAVLFMHDKVKEFAFGLESEDLMSLATDVVGRMPSLLSLKCMCLDAFYDPNHDSILKHLVSHLPKLQEITLPKQALGGQILKALSLLPELRALLYDNIGGIRGTFAPVIADALEDGAFPMLDDLCLDSTLEDMRHYLTGGALLPRIRHISVESANPESPLAVQEFLSDVTRCYPLLETIAIDVIVSIEVQEQEACEPLMLEHVHPILSLGQLTRLELRHNLPLQISEDDMAEFGAALPAIEFLILNPEPLLLSKPRLSIHSLPTIGQNFPNLLHLEIYLDAEDVGTQPTPPPLATMRVFPYLRVLHVGVSPLGPDQVPVALFLSYLLSENESVDIRSGSSWDSELFENSAEYGTMLQERCQRWGEVAKTLPLLLQLRKEEKAHRRDIEKEVEDLRMRNEILMGNMHLNEDVKPLSYDKGCIVC
ncbi:hypothetical protein EI94DRAFT_1724445 [Lactarius quietus]|nr:hypothetical protein EI94DRAFT_1724445 [Lactarius quietus]